MSAELKAAVIRFDDFLNEPPSRECSESGEAREYRFAAYREWQLLDKAMQAEIESLREQLAVMKRRVADLEAWKELSSRVLSAIDLQVVAKALAIPLGEEVSDKVLPGIRALKAERDALRDQLAAAQAHAAVADPDIPDGALGQDELFHSIGLKWIRYAQATHDANDIAVAIWSAMAEVKALAGGASESESRCANCGKPASQAAEFLADYPEEGEWFCGSECKEQHDELGCPHETHDGYRHPVESRRLVAAKDVLAKSGEKP